MGKPSMSAQTQVGPEVIEDLLAAGIPLRTLLAYGLRCLDWLLRQSDDRLRISYENDAGIIVHEKVSRLGLLQRASELGWKPWPSDGEDSECVCFYDAIVFRDESDDTWWWATDFDEETNAPACFSKQKLANLRAAKAAESGNFPTAQLAG